MNHQTAEKTEIPKANMQTIVMKKSELIKILKENKEKHDGLLATAISGYWELAKEKVETKKQKLEQSLTQFKQDIYTSLDRIIQQIDKKEILPNRIEFNSLSWNNTINLVYPEDHSKDYNRAIRIMELSIYEEVTLTQHEFEMYVLNNWAWKDAFVGSNALYVDTVRSRYGQKGVSDAIASACSGSAILMSTGIFQKGVQNF